MPDFISFSVYEDNDNEKILDKLSSIESDLLVVRSSAIGEDSIENSKAGEYHLY